MVITVSFLNIRASRFEGCSSVILYFHGVVILYQVTVFIFILQFAVQCLLRPTREIAIILLAVIVIMQ